LKAACRPIVDARSSALSGLQELAVRIELDRQQVGRLEDALLLAEILADALLLGEGVSHLETLREPARAEMNEVRARLAPPTPSDARRNTLA
jgi:hypothetical protein